MAMLSDRASRSRRRGRWTECPSGNDMGQGQTIVAGLRAGHVAGTPAVKDPIAALVVPAAAGDRASPKASRA